MTADFLVDTNVWSELIKRSAHHNVVSWYENSSSSLFLSVITLHEFQYGLLRHPSPLMKKAGEKVIAGYDVLDVNSAIANLAAQLRAGLAAKGQVLHLADSLIAATAKIHNFILVTRNTRDFEGIEVTLLNPFDENPFK